MNATLCQLSDKRLSSVAILTMGKGLNPIVYPKPKKISQLRVTF